nr:MAG TPA: hypothetical protein [Caudoviricetes sp.]
MVKQLRETVLEWTTTISLKFHFANFIQIIR